MPHPGEPLLEEGGEGGNSRLGRVSVPPQEGEDSEEQRSLGAFHVPSASRAQRAPGRIGSHQPTCSHSQKLPW